MSNLANRIEFRVWGRYAMFTDPLTRVGGEKCSYHIPTHEALKGIAKSIYWKPTFIWVIDAVRIIKRIQTQTKGLKPLKYSSSENELAIYTFLTGDLDATGAPGVEYQVRAHFEWNKNRPELEQDRIDGKHYAIARRSLDMGGRQDIFLGTRDCQGYVAPCKFGSGTGAYDGKGELGFGLMFHSFDYPDETGENMLRANFWCPKMLNGVINFPLPKDCLKKDICAMVPKKFGLNGTMRAVEEEARDWGIDELDAETL